MVATIGSQVLTEAEAVRIFHPMSATEVQALLAQTKAAASAGEFELFKTSSIFDSTATHPDWLGEEPPHVREMLNA
jgi:hypothetical protein